MINDPIVEEIHRFRQQYAAKFDYDLKAIYRDIKEKEKQHADRLVQPPKRKRIPKAVNSKR
jgi:hypothetical protein